MTFEDKSSEKKLGAKLLVIVIILVCVATIVFLTRGCRNTSKVITTTPHIEVNKYDILVEDWNRASVNAKLSKVFYLPDANPEAVINRLNALNRSFYKCPSQELQNELKKITQGRKYSFFVFYANFLKTYCITTSLTFDSNQSSAEIRKLISQITKQDRINTKAVAIIASINNPCLYFDTFKDDLYKKGMSKNLRSCKDLRIDKSKYPLLFELVNKKE
jgi:hypothetical protein